MRKGASCIPLSQWESETHKRTEPLQPSPLSSLPSAPALQTGSLFSIPFSFSFLLFTSIL